MADSASPYRLATPAHQAYDTSPGVQMVLRSLTPENMGMMYGFLAGQRADASAGQAGYGQLLTSVNRQQQQLAEQKLAQERREGQQRTVLGLVQHGNLPMSSALNALDLTGLPGFLSRQQAAEGVLEGDNQTAQLNYGRALESSGAGAYSAAQAGLYTPPGTPIGPGPGGVVNAPRVAGDPLALRREELQNAGQAAREGAFPFGSNYDPLRRETTFTVKGRNVEDVHRNTQALRDMFENSRNEETQRRRGNLGADGFRMPTPNPPAAAPSPPATAIPPPPAGTPRPITNVPTQLQGGLTGGDPARQAPPQTTTVTGRGTASGANATGFTNLTPGERANLRRVETRYGSVTGTTRIGDKVYANTPRGRIEITATE